MCPLNSARHFRFSKRRTSSGFIRSRCVLLRVCEYGRVDEYTGENSGIIGIWLLRTEIVTFAAFLRNVLCRRQIVAAHIERLVERRQLIFPLLARILFLPLRKALHDDLRGHIEAADAVQTVRHAVQIADVAVFVEAKICQHRQPPARALQARKV